MIRLKCDCCGFEQDFDDAQQAFDKGWDTLPHISGYVTCHLCPGVCVVLGASHAKAHAYWAEHGRPPEFGPLCFADLDFVELPPPGPLTEVARQSLPADIDRMRSLGYDTETILAGLAERPDFFRPETAPDKIEFMGRFGAVIEELARLAALMRRQRRV